MTGNSMNNKKIKVLIVEDEYRIGMLIRKLIRWDDFDMECQGMAEDGEKALEAIRAEKPDVVITDIRMPKIGGLDLICMAKELYDDIRFIVISGYKEFEYAHRALQYEVDGYLLKPINENELNDTLRKIYEKLRTDEKKSLEQQRLAEAVEKSQKIIKRDFLRNIIEERDEQENEETEVVLRGDIYRGIDIKLDYMDVHRSDRKQDRMTVEKISSIVEDILSRTAEEVLICEKEALHIYCLFNYNDSRTKEIRNCINDMLSGIQNYLLRFEQYEVTIGVGSERSCCGEIRYSIREAYRAVGNRIKLGTGRLIYAETIGKHFVNPVKQKSEELSACVSGYAPEKMELLINQCFVEFMGQQDVDYSGAYEIAYELVETVFRSIDGEENELEKSRRAVWEGSQHFHTVTGLRDYLKEELLKAVRMSRDAAESESQKPIRQAKTYIDQHFGEKIVLEDIAEIVGLNPVYFSVLFKKETDMNFSTYLTNVRMEKAREMLSSTNETIAAVSERVGYKDSRYFSQTFTRLVGIKPAIYRRLHS